MRNLLLLCFCFLFAVQPLCAEDKTDEEGKELTSSYYQIKPSLIANLASGGKYIRCDIQLLTRSEAFLEKLNLHGPVIRHALLLLLSEQDGKALKTQEGKETLRKAALSTISNQMKEMSGKDEVEALFFTTFFVQ